jgi:hypothetical protein
MKKIRCRKSHVRLLLKTHIMCKTQEAYRGLQFFFNFLANNKLVTAVLCLEVIFANKLPGLGLIKTLDSEHI